MIVITVPTGSPGGYGDYMFALRAAAGIKKHLSALGLNDEICLVTDDEGVKKIKSLEGEKEFKVNLLSYSEYKDKKLDFYVEGPITFSDCEVNPNLSIPQQTPVMFLTEYSHYSKYIMSELPKLYQQQVKPNYLSTVSTGFGVQNDCVFLDDYLTNVSEQKEKNQKDYIPEAINRFGKYAGLIFQTEEKDNAESLMSKVDKYRSNTDLYMEYSENLWDVINNENACYHFLQSHLELLKGDKERKAKHQDIVCIGKNKHPKRIALDSIKNAAFQAGFTKVVLIEDGQETLSYDTKEEPAKVYRLIYISKLKHTAMEGLFALSNDDLCGVTGDQSVTELLSMQKSIMVYECRDHKRKLLENYTEFIGNHIAENNRSEKGDVLSDKAKRLHELLQKVKTTQEWKEFSELSNDKELLKAIKSAQTSLKKNGDLARILANKIALTLGIQRGDLQVVKNAISHGAKFYEMDDQGITPLAYALTNKQYAIANYLLDQALQQGITMNIPTVKVESSALSSHIEKHQKNMGLIQAINKNDITQLDEKNINMITDQGITPLIAAVQNQNEDIIKKLLILKPNLNLHYSGNTALMQAVVLGNEKIVKQLLDAGADFNIPDKYGYTPFLMAAKLGKANVLKAFLDKEADLNTQTPNGFAKLLKSSNIYADNALFLAIRNDHVDIVKLLVKFYKNYNLLESTSIFDETPLLAVVSKDRTIDQNNKEKILQNFMTLLAAGADFRKQTLYGSDLFSHAREKAYKLVYMPKKIGGVLKDNQFYFKVENGKLHYMVKHPVKKSVSGTITNKDISHLNQEIQDPVDETQIDVLFADILKITKDRGDTQHAFETEVREITSFYQHKLLPIKRWLSNFQRTIPEFFNPFFDQFVENLKPKDIIPMSTEIQKCLDAFLYYLEQRISWNTQLSEELSARLSPHEIEIPKNPPGLNALIDFSVKWQAWPCLMHLLREQSNLSEIKLDPKCVLPVRDAFIDYLSSIKEKFRIEEVNQVLKQENALGCFLNDPESVRKIKTILFNIENKASLQTSNIFMDKVPEQPTVSPSDQKHKL